MEELEILEMRIQLQQNLKIASRSLDRSSSCENNSCGFEFDQSSWIDAVLPCEGETRKARRTIYTHFGDALRAEKDIVMTPCA